MTSIAESVRNQDTIRQAEIHALADQTLTPTQTFQILDQPVAQTATLVFDRYTLLGLIIAVVGVPACIWFFGVSLS